MVTYISWHEAIKDYLTRDQAIHTTTNPRLPPHAPHCHCCLGRRKGIELHEFGKRHMDAYIKMRRELDRSLKT